MDAKTIISILVQARKDKRYVFICGNGGSSCDSEHLAEDLFEKGIRAIALTNIGVITSIANDYSYDLVFSKQLQVYADKDDILITLSTSGTSENIVQIQSFAKLNDMLVINFPTNSDTGMVTALTQNVHKQLIHDIYIGL
mgnify:FL=1